MPRAIAFSLLLVLTTAGFGSSTYHVSAKGLDTNVGSLAKPWKTIQHACDAVAAGDTVIVHKGAYPGRVIVRRSMNLVANTGDRPIIDGTGIATPADDAGLVLIKDLSHVVFSGFEVKNFITTQSQRCPIGIFVEGVGDQIEVRNNLVHNIENNGTNASLINALGIAVYGNSLTGAITNVILDGNEVRNTKTGSSETVTINGNVDGFQVTHNYVHNTDNIGIDCIGFEGTSKIDGQDQTRNGVVADNVVATVTSALNPAYGGDRAADGIYVDGGSNIVIERNIVRSADIGIEVASEHQGHDSTGVIVRNNLVYSSYVVGLSIGGYAANKGGTSNCTFVGNTLCQNDTKKTGTGEFQIQYNTANNVFANNILVAGKMGVLISSVRGTNSTIGLTADHNLYFTAAKPTWTWNGHIYKTLATLAAGTGGESHSLFVDPAFVDPLTFDFHLSAGSFGIDAGDDLSAGILGSTDLAGNARNQGSHVDLGCFEKVVSLPLLSLLIR